MKYNRWTVIKTFKHIDTNREMAECICDCGTKKTVNFYTLKKGKSQSCGCLQKENTAKAKRINLVGKKFGKLKVISRDKNSTKWICKCECGKSSIVTTSNLTTGNSTSCGCHVGLNLKIHGQYKHPSYVHWRTMKQRCNNPNSSDYKNYGGRGIKICNRWKNIKNFIIDMGIPPTKKHTLDRIDVNDDYKPTNCRWATRKTQSNNRRNTLKLDGITLKKWCELNNLCYNTTYQRFKKGWSKEKLLNPPTIRKYEKNQKCSIKTCNNLVIAKNMCNKHYLQWWKGKQKLKKEK